MLCCKPVYIILVGLIIASGLLLHSKELAEVERQSPLKVEEARNMDQLTSLCTFGL